MLSAFTLFYNNKLIFVLSEVKDAALYFMLTKKSLICFINKKVINNLTTNWPSMINIIKLINRIVVN